MRDGHLIKDYVDTDPNPTVQLSFGGTVVGVRPSPVVASFSSRGPNSLTPQILKPDILAPGVNILAAWTGAADKDKSNTDHYNIISGTSMACPHATGVAALVKAAHPNWSPSAIRSALMTSAYTTDNTGPGSVITDEKTAEPANPWAYGSGHINPRKALSPGLVYDISSQDYLTFICSLGYPLKDVQALANNPNLTCSEKFTHLGQLNYPSFSVAFDNKTKEIRYTRELTNVGVAQSTYEASVTAPPFVVVKVEPSHLVFENVGDKHKYEVIFMLSQIPPAQTHDAFGSIVWSSTTYMVRSPIAFNWA
ncbi:Subtilisin-like protease [Euphorbia peplus]|nr:Subtilisin-like protease [Euphorbia peplus]